MPYLFQSSDSFNGDVATVVATTVVATVVQNTYNINFQGANVPPACFLTYRDNGDDFTITGLSSAMEFCGKSVVFKPTLKSHELMELRGLFAVMLFNHFNY
uniref:Uncharacterized protein n=1 Tax=viral metagenome TaxID=1070528 RepID=A0A6C0DYU0_9ZZZZ